MKKNYLQSFESYRGLSACMICAAHFNVNSPITMHALANGLLVNFFFVLSGFVMYLTYHNRLIDFNSVKNFLIKRFFRLYPLHLLFLIVFVIIEISKYFVQIKYGLVANNEAFSDNNFKSFLGNIFLVQTFFDYNSFNTPSWSISAEFYTYMIFGLVFFFMKKTNLLIFVSLVGILMFRINSEVGLGYDKTYLSFLDCVYSFFIGVFSCKIYFKYSNHETYKKYYSIASLILLIASCLLIINVGDKLTFIIPFFYGALLIFSANLKNENILGKIICNKFFVYLGSISYSIYMCHLFVFWSLTQFLRFIIKLDTILDDNGITKLDLNILEATIMVVVSYTLTIILSHILYNYFEKRFYKPS